MTLPLRSPFSRISTVFGTRVKPRWTMLTLLAAIGAVGATTSAQRAPQSAPNYDVRTAKTLEASGYVTRFGAPASVADDVARRAMSQAELQRAQPAAEIEVNPALGTPEIVGVRPGYGFLTGPSADRVGTMRGFLSTYADLYGVAAGGAAQLVLVADYMNPAGNMGWVEFEQRINGLPVFQGLIRGGFTAQGELARTTGPLAGGLDPALLPTSPSLGAEQAVSTAAATVNWVVPQGAIAIKGTDQLGRLTLSRGPMADDARAWLVYFPISPGIARLAWVTEIWGETDAYMILVDAFDGTLLFRKNLTNYQTQTATYHVYNDDSPAPMSPSTTLPGMGTQAPVIGRTPFTLIGNEGPLAFNNLGWMTDGANSTDGNNVQAGIDRDGTNGVDAAVVGAARVFDFAYNPGPGAPPPGDDPLTVAYQNGEVTDGFYWTNVYHDRLYLLGFTEVARNFQNDNFGRGGVQLDRVSAEFQDSSGVENANFSTPSDGGRGRMQMYIFPGPTPDRSSGLDHDVLIHELTHGTSNRLHNNAAGLLTQMAAGMGEGWSDFYARALLSTAAENPDDVYSTGGWVTYQLGGTAFADNYYYGIRRFPYASRSTVGPNGRPHNPLTFADIDGGQVNVNDGAFPPNPLFGVGPAFEVHNVGEVWAMTLFEVRALFIKRLGWATGNQRILQFVTDGMKLDPVNPTMLQARDSILAAAMAGGGTAADIADIWQGFAVRGMGYSARVLNVVTGSVVEAFDIPGIAANGGTLVGESVPNGRLDPGETVQLSLCVTNLALSTSGNVTGALQATGGVLSPSAPQSYGTVAPAGNVCRTYSVIVGPSCGSVLTATLQAQEAGGFTRNLTYTFQVGSQALALAESFDGVAAPALPAGWATSTLSGTPNLWGTNVTTPDTPPNRAFTGDPATISDNVLVSPVAAIPATGAMVSFRNHYNLETNFDGGVLEISINGGAYADIITAGGSFVSGGYTGTISTAFGNPIGGRQAWSGNAGGYITSTATLPAAANGQNITLRWRMASDNAVSATGWGVDTITVFSYTCSSLAPVITTQPQSQTVTTGTSATLSVYAAGAATLTYQWYAGPSGDTSAPIAGATVSTYVTPALVAPASYWVRVSNGAGFADSNTANITIGPAAGAEMVTNGDFSAGASNWLMFEEPDIQWSVVGGEFQFYRQNPTTTLSGQATVFQETTMAVAAGTPLTAQFDIGNSSAVRKRITVLLIDSNFSDITGCTFWLAPGAPMRTYSLRTHTTKNWTNAAIYFYAATKGQDGGVYRLDNVSMKYTPATSTSRTDCVDPTMPAPPGGAPSPTLLANGDFSAGMTSWATFGVIQPQVAGGVFEFIRPAPGPATPAGTVFQATGQAMTANEFMTATFQLGNSSAVRKRVTVLGVSDAAFSDLWACTFWIAPGQPLQDYAIRSRATTAWTDATLYLYGATVGNETWTRLDNVTLTRTPGTAMLGTECIEPTPPVVGSVAASVAYPIPILDEAVTAVGGNLYVFGGVSTAIIATSNRFNGTAWTPIAPLPQGLEFPAAVTNGTDIFVLGGASTAGTPQTTLYRYNVATNNYTTLAPFTTGTWNHAAVYLNGKIYKFAGTGPATASTSAHEIYDVVSNTWSAGAAYPLAISFVSAWTDGTYIYGAGGIQSVGSAASVKTYRYDPVANTWSDAAIADLPITRWGAATAIYNGRVLLAGGYVSGSTTASLSASSVSWDPVANSWVAGPMLLGERSRMTGAVLNGGFHIIGGRSVASPTFGGTNDNQRLGAGSPFADPGGTGGGSGGAVGGDDFGPWTLGLAVASPPLSGLASTAPSSGDASRDGTASGGDRTRDAGSDGSRWKVVTDAAGQSAHYWLRPIDLTDATSAVLTFDSRFSNRAGSGAVQATLDGLTWESVGDVENDDGRVSIDLSRYAGRVVYVRFVFTRAGAWSIGDVALIVR
jgi:hypothetical protein